MSISILNKRRILVIGDIMLDVYVEANVNRISPEAPVPVLDYKKSHSMAGAAANVARNIASLGSECTLVSVVGDDQYGRDLIGLIGDIQGINPYVKTSKERITTTKTRYISGSHQMFRLDREVISEIPENLMNELYNIIMAEIPNHDAILISDYAKGIISKRLLAKIFNNKIKIPVIVDSKARDYSVFKDATVVTPNLHELYSVTNIHDIKIAANYLIDNCGIQNVLVTQGPDGMTLYDGVGAHHILAVAKGIVDVTGAGDTVAAVMAIGLANNEDMRNCMKLANEAAAVVVMKPGVATVTQGELTWKPMLH